MSDGGRSGAEKRWAGKTGNENTHNNNDGNKVVQNYTSSLN